jgi:hypothetical protein
MSSVVTSRRTLARLVAVSLTSSVFVRSSIATLPRSESSVFSDSPWISVASSAAFA